MDNLDYLSLVKEFHIAFKVPISDEPTLLEPTDIIRRISLIASEFGELADAVRKKCIMEIADAIGDILYVSFGTAVEMGLYIFCDLKKIKFKSESNLLTQGDTLTCLTNIMAAMCAVTLSIDEENLQQINSDLDFLISETFKMASKMGLPINKIFTQIHRSNMSKKWSDGKVHTDIGGKVIKNPKFKPIDLSWIMCKEDSRPVPCHMCLTYGDNK